MELGLSFPYHGLRIGMVTASSQSLLVLEFYRESTFIVGEENDHGFLPQRSGPFS